MPFHVHARFSLRLHFSEFERKLRELTASWPNFVLNGLNPQIMLILVMHVMRTTFVLQLSSANYFKSRFPTSDFLPLCDGIGDH